MASAIRGSTYKFKQIENAYDSLRNAGLNRIADEVEKYMQKLGYYPQLVRDKYKFKFRL